MATVMTLLKRQEETQREVDRKRTFFQSLQEGDEIEVDVRRRQVPGGRSFQKTRGRIIHHTPRHLTYVYKAERGREAKDSVNINSYLCGDYEIRKIAGSPVEIRGGDKLPRLIIEPPVDELIEKYEELRSIQRLGDYYGVHTNTAQKWLKSARKKIEKESQAPVVEENNVAPCECEPPVEAEVEAVEEIHWYIGERPVKVNTDPTIRINISKIYISDPAAELIGLKFDDRVAIGTSSKALYIKKLLPEEKGLKICRDKNKLMLSNKGLSRYLEGWEVPCSLMMELKDGMLMARKPEIKERVS
jgi:hypothetical protein